MKTLFGVMAGTALALSPVAAFSQAAPAANQNVAAVTTPEVSFTTLDGRDRSIRFVRAGAAEASSDKIAIVVFSGNQVLQREAYATAIQLRDEGFSLALILGPSLDPSNSSAAIQVYAQGVPVYEGYGAVIGEDNVDHFRAETLRGARSAHQRHFGEHPSLAMAQGLN